MIFKSDSFMAGGVAKNPFVRGCDVEGFAPMKGSLASLGVVVALAASLWGGCTTHGDGGRCDSKNGNADCDNGLVCTRAQEILLPEGGVSQSDICCPQDRSTAPAGD